MSPPGGVRGGRLLAVSCRGRVRGVEGVVVDALALGGLVLGVDDGQVVDAGRRGRPGRGLGPGPGVGVAADLLRDREPVGPAVPPDLDAGEVERVEDQFDAAAGQNRVGLVDAAEQLHGGGLGGDDPLLGPQERIAQLGLSGSNTRSRW